MKDKITPEFIAKNEVFVCCNKTGPILRFKPKNNAEKQWMYKYFKFVIQTGYRCSDKVKLMFKDNTWRSLDPGKLRIGKHYFISRKEVATISLEK